MYVPQIYSWIAIVDRLVFRRSLVLYYFAHTAVTNKELLLPRTDGAAFGVIETFCWSLILVHISVDDDSLCNQLKYRPRSVCDSDK